MKTPRRRAGFSLLEVVLSLAIFGVAAVMLTELAELSLRRAASCRDVTQAQFIADSIMTELIVGVRELENVADSPYRGEGEGITEAANWNFSVEVSSIDADGLLSIRVFVSQNIDDPRRAAQFALTRLIQDPDSVPVEEETTSESSSTFASFGRREGSHG